MNLRQALRAALRGDPELIPKVTRLLRDRIDGEDGRMATVVRGAEALQPVIADAVRKRPSRLGKLGLSSTQLLASLSANEDRSRLEEIAKGSHVGIMFVDISDFTTFTATHGDEAAVEVLNKLTKRVESCAKTCKGELVKTLGDGYLLAYPSASQAVRCAIRIAEVAARLGSRHPKFAVRIAVHAGEPSVEGDDLLGHDVNLTARILDHCKAGEVCVSEAAKELAEKRLRATEFSKPRKVKVKGLASKVPLYSITP